MDTEKNNETTASCPVFARADRTRLISFENTMEGLHLVTSCAFRIRFRAQVHAFAYSCIHGGNVVLYSVLKIPNLIGRIFRIELDPTVSDSNFTCGGKAFHLQGVKCEQTACQTCPHEKKGKSNNEKNEKGRDTLTTSISQNIHVLIHLSSYHPCHVPIVRPPRACLGEHCCHVHGANHNDITVL
jgi:hypothetical protein